MEKTRLDRLRPGLRAGACRAGARLALAAAVVSAGAETAVAASQPGEPPTAEAFRVFNRVTPLGTKTFATPPQNDMPWVRWNFPPATATVTELTTELQDMFDHHIAGVEIGQGGIPTLEQLRAIYAKADQLGITVSLKVAPYLPGAAKTEDLARRTLASARQTVDAGGVLTGAVPGPPTGTIVAVLAYRCSAAPCATTGTVQLDRASVIDLTSTLTATNTAGYNRGTTAGTLNWTAPASAGSGQWVVLTFRAVLFGATSETLSRAGTKEVTDAYDAYFKGELGGLVKRNGGDFFVDSHAGDPWGAPEELWSTNLRNEFKARAGYDLLPNLAALVDPTMAGANLGGAPTAGPYYTFDDGSASRIRTDFNKVRSDLYTENRLLPFQAWARTYNMKLRQQQEDGPITSIGDQLQTSRVIDRPEYESLTGSDQTDIYRPMASANHITGNTWYSTECCAVLNQSYVATFRDAIVRMNHEFAGGVNRPVYHVYPYLETPASTWPGLGFAVNKVSFSNAWNRTEPYWIDAAAINAYFARNHMVLTQGAAKTDVAVYMRSYSSPSAYSTSDPSNRRWQDVSLQRAGFTWDYLNEELFSLPNAVVRGGRLAVDGPAYKALVFDRDLYPTSNTARGGLSLVAARKILEYAKGGLPVIFVGRPTGTASVMPGASDAALSAIVDEILSQKRSRLVASEADVPAALVALGVVPAARPAAPTSLLSVRRSDAAARTDYYYLYNQGVDAWPGGNTKFGLNPSNLYEEPSACRVTGSVPNPCMGTGEAVDTLVTLEGRGSPYALDTFTGAITPIAQYTTTASAVTVRIQLARDASTVIALSQAAKPFGAAAANLGVTSTTADSAAQVAGQTVVRAVRVGDYATTLANGKVVRSRIGVAPAPMDLTHSRWRLEVEDWQPTHPYGATGADGSRTTKSPISVDLPGLKPWPDIPQLESTSGVGIYSTTIDLPNDWDASVGAVIRLGQVTDTFTLTVNGHAVPIDQIAASAEIGPWLKAGSNTLSVRVATTLNNRLSALDPAVKTRGVIQAYGLVGPVTVTPYRQAVVSGR